MMVNNLSATTSAHLVDQFNHDLRRVWTRVSGLTAKERRIVITEYTKVKLIDIKQAVPTIDLGKFLSILANSFKTAVCTNEDILTPSFTHTASMNKHAPPQAENGEKIIVKRLLRLFSIEFIGDSDIDNKRALELINKLSAIATKLSAYDKTLFSALSQYIDMRRGKDIASVNATKSMLHELITLLAPDFMSEAIANQGKKNVDSLKILAFDELIRKHKNLNDLYKNGMLVDMWRAIYLKNMESYDK